MKFTAFLFTIVLGVAVTLLVAFFLLHDVNSFSALRENEYLQLDTKEVSALQGLFELSAEKNTVDNMLFQLFPNFLLWAVLIACSVGFGAALIPTLLLDIAYLYRQHRKKYFLLITLFGFSCFVLINFLGNNRSGNIYLPTNIFDHAIRFFHHPQLIFDLIVITMLLPSAIATIGYFLLMGLITSQLQGRNRIADILQHYQLFNKFLLASSIMLVLGVITTSLLRLFVLELIKPEYHAVYSIQSVIVYGLIFTFFLVLFYVPGAVLFYGKFQDLKTDADQETKERIENELSQRNYFKMALTLVAPFASSLLLELVV